jgi:anti-sigma factor RsiW
MAKLKLAEKSRINDSCKKMTDLILDYVTDQLSPALKDEFERHLQICPDCVNFLTTYRKTMSQTKSLSAATIPAKVRKNILAFLRRKTHRVVALFLYLIAQVTG